MEPKSIGSQFGIFWIFIFPEIFWEGEFNETKNKFSVGYTRLKNCVQQNVNKKRELNSYLKRK